MIVVDTDVISELLLPSPEPAVEAWLTAQDGQNIYLTTISEAELLYGLGMMMGGKRRKALEATISQILRDDMAGRILAFDSAAARAFAVIAARHHRTGKTISQASCQIAAIALAHGASVATGNASEFKGCGVDLINPWTTA